MKTCSQCIQNIQKSQGTHGVDWNYGYMEPLTLPVQDLTWMNSRSRNGHLSLFEHMQERCLLGNGAENRMNGMEGI